MTEERLFIFTQDEVKQALIYQLPLNLGHINPEQVTVVQHGNKTVLRLDLAPPKPEPVQEKFPSTYGGYDVEQDDEFDDEDSVDNEEDE